jgi:aarF domain-containing kinase
MSLNSCIVCCGVFAGARIGLIDYGQSKQLPEAERLAFAALLLELGRERRDVRPAAVARCLADLGLRFERSDNEALMTKMAFGMFDTRTSHRCYRAFLKRSDYSPGQ